MWQSFWLIALLLVSPSLRAVEVEDNLGVLFSGENAKLSFADKNMDQGVVPQGQELLFQFPYEVKGSGRVTILGIHQECGCLSQSLKAGQSLAAGEKGLLTIRADTSLFKGHFDKRVTILTNEEGASPKVFRLKAQIEPTLSIVPPIVEMDFVNGKTPKIATVRIQNTSKQSLHIEKVTYNEDTFSVAVAPIDDIWEIQIRWKGDAPEKPRFETIELLTNSRVKRIRIPVVGSPHILSH